MGTGWEFRLCPGRRAYLGAISYRAVGPHPSDALMMEAAPKVVGVSTTRTANWDRQNHVDAMDSRKP